MTWMWNLTRAAKVRVKLSPPRTILRVLLSCLFVLVIVCSSLWLATDPDKWSLGVWHSFLVVTSSRTWFSSDRNALMNETALKYFSTVLPVVDGRDEPKPGPEPGAPVGNNNGSSAAAAESSSGQSKLILFWSSLGSKRDYWNHWYNYEENLKLCKNKCTWTTDRSRIKEADLVMFCMYTSDVNRHDVPEYRTPDQLWGIFSHESPLSVGRDKTSYDEWNGLFNVTVVGRLDADVPAVHGKIIDKDKIDGQVRMAEDIGASPDMSTKNGRGAAVISNCQGSSLRRELIAAIGAESGFPIDVYGACGSNQCAPGKETDACYALLARNYSFLMAFENSLCRDYVTEKMFRAVLFPWIPVVWGGGNYGKIAPPLSYIDARQFDGPRQLGEHLRFLAGNETEYLRYFDWKKRYSVSAHGTSFVCDICDKVHSPGPRKQYDDLYKWWVQDSHCITPHANGNDTFTFRNGSSLLAHLRRLSDM